MKEKIKFNVTTDGAMIVDPEVVIAQLVKGGEEKYLITTQEKWEKYKELLWKDYQCVLIKYNEGD